MYVFALSFVGNAPCARLLVDVAESPEGVCIVRLSDDGCVYVESIGMQYFFALRQRYYRAPVIHLAVDGGQTGAKSRGVGFVTRPGQPGAWLPPVVASQGNAGAFF